MRRFLLLLIAGMGAAWLAAGELSAESPARDARGWLAVEGKTASGLVDALGGGGPHPAPELAVPLISPEAEAADLDTLITRTTFLFYYSATCPHCQHVAPEVARLAERLSDRVDFVSIASGSNSLSEIRDFRKDYELNFPAYKDLTRRFASENQMTSTPTVLIVQPTEDGQFETLGAFRPFFEGADLLAELRIRVLLGDDPFTAFEADRYVGPRACGGCHVHEFSSWGLTHHSVAYWTLYEREKAEDEACVGCHVTGFGEPGGFSLGEHHSPLVDVSCESCHGPGGPHDGKSEPLAQSRTVCVACHDADHSIQFDADRALPHIDHFTSTHLDPVSFQKAREDLLEGRAPRPLLAFPEGSNLGSQACKSCHPAQSRSWKRDPHSSALKTLRSKGSQKDVSCLQCHAVRQEVPAETPADFHDGGVGCESCHGPGEAHVAAEGGTENIVGLGSTCPECVIEAICTRCHTPEQDPDWDLATALPKVKH